MRLNKYISETGVCSRREADKWIEAGRVTLNGQAATLGTQVADGDEVRIDGDLIGLKKKQVYIALNKPVGIICTTEAHIEDNIIDHVGYPERIFPVGRLDRDSEGLILLTNNGDIVNEILRSENNHEKEYMVTVDRPITDLSLRMLAAGVKIMGELTKPSKVTRVERAIVSNHSHARTKSPNPPHVFGARLQSPAPAARAHHEYPLGEFAARPVASSDTAGTRRADRLARSGAALAGVGGRNAIRPLPPAADAPIGILGLVRQPPIKVPALIGPI